MKKLSVLVCAIACSVFSYAQGLGDYMEIDGVPGFVFYLDETGEHGLMMSFLALSEKQAKKIQAKAAKKGAADAYEPSKLIIKGETRVFKERKQFYPELIEYLSDNGEQNAIAIVEFCKEKDLDLQRYFPEHYWASQLGEGWFVPGKNELILFAEFLTGGIGQEHKIKGAGINKRVKEVSNDASVQANLWVITFNGILSSSMEDSNNGFLGLVKYWKKGGLGSSSEWFELSDRFTTGKVLVGSVPIKQTAENTVKGIVAVHKF